jgi:tetratricopeptide (TPR) repeat protein
MTRRAVLTVIVAVVVAASGARAQNELGSIEFPTSGAAAAQPAFIKGVLLMHSFEYDDAKEAFQQAQQADPGFAMAYWGEAMTYNHAIWQQTAPEPAKAALARLAPTPEARLAKAPTAKEKDWLASLDALYGPGEKLTRDLAYAEAMRRMYEKYPGDNEVASFYALALLGTSHGGRDFSIYMKAAAIVEQVYAKNPQHPGAAHYLIHSYDDPIHAPLGLRYADAYSKIAPAASHALHMPSHIYFALGMWDEAAAINERSVKAADARRAEQKLDVDARGFHALLWLVYGYAQQGRYEEARGVLQQIEADAAKSGSVRTRSHLALARAAFLIETRKWGEAKAAVNASGLGKDAAIANLFANGFAAIRLGNRTGAANALQQMAALMEDAPVNGAPVQPAPGTKPAGAKPGISVVTPRPRPTAPAPTAVTATGAHVDHTGRPQTGLPAAGGAGDKRVGQVMAQQLEAALLFIEGRRGEALVLARQAAVVEDSLSFEFGPPVPVKPAYELVGEMLMDLRQPKEAMQAFELSLKKNPKRALSLLGLGRAATLVKDTATARRAYGELQQIWKRADKNLPELKEIGAVRPASSF